MQTIYKILFEVRLLHEFYLTKPDGSSIFGLASAAARDSFLQDFFDRTQRSINSDIAYRIPPDSTSLFKNYRLKLLSTYSGFKIATEVTRTTDAGKTAYKPVAPLPAGLNIPVLLVRTNNDFDSYTNRRFHPYFDAIYYLSNNSTITPKIFPFLNNTVPTQIATTIYEQGELSQANGIVNAFYIDGTGTQQFAPVTGKNYLNEADRILVYPSFLYYFTAADNLKNATFTLKDKDNAAVYTTTAKNDAGLLTARINISEQTIKALPNTAAEPATLYTLLVTGDNGFNRSHKLFFLKGSLAAQGAWGLINICSQPSDAAYSCLDNKGLLLTPIFEVNIKSRFAFWRYNNDQGRPLKDSHAGTLKPVGNNLISSIPQSSTYAPTSVQGVPLPNPKLFSSVKPEGQQIFADIIVSESDIFPLGP